MVKAPQGGSLLFILDVISGAEAAVVMLLVVTGRMQLTLLVAPPGADMIPIAVTVSAQVALVPV
jgi:hypothetical protein